MPTSAELIESYASGPAQLRAAVAGMTPEQLRARPVAGAWSTLEVVAHIADFEPVYADRIRRTLALKKPLLLTADENEYVKHLAYHDRDIGEELGFIEATRRTTARILRAVPADAWARVGIHSEKGVVTVEQLVATITGHIPHHLTFLAAKKAALGLT